MIWISKKKATSTAVTYPQANISAILATHNYTQLFLLYPGGNMPYNLLASINLPTPGGPAETLTHYMSSASCNF
ncbi:MAG: hypothetical protein AB8U16_06905 [Rickettsiales endosymbiont of Dermacentor nuttalli]